MSIVKRPDIRRPLVPAFAVAVTASVLLAAGCGGSSPSGIASIATTTSQRTAGATAAAGAASSGSGQEQRQQDALKYSQCMRANGVPGFPDPSSTGGIEIPIGSGIDPSSPAFESAQAKCQKLRPGGGLAPGAATHPSAQWLAKMVKASHCMRRHGVTDFPDPRTSVPAHPFANGATGMVSDIQGVIFVFPSSIDQQSPVFARAAAACGFPLHNH